mmetsp:Transcript_37512/g.87396  ORF Transcript_37512/g.87396 Transcript_37512/m.87396 type:complete len:207 (-) Transcript_37512:962-1582(-)
MHALDGLSRVRRPNPCAQSQVMPAPRPSRAASAPAATPAAKRPVPFAPPARSGKLARLVRRRPVDQLRIAQPLGIAQANRSSHLMGWRVEQGQALDVQLMRARTPAGQMNEAGIGRVGAVLRLGLAAQGLHQVVREMPARRKGRPHLGIGIAKVGELGLDTLVVSRKARRQAGAIGHRHLHDQVARAVQQAGREGQATVQPQLVGQ